MLKRVHVLLVVVLAVRSLATAPTDTASQADPAPDVAPTKAPVPRHPPTATAPAPPQAPQSAPSSQPALDLRTAWTNADPLVQKIVIGAAGLIVLSLLLGWLGRRREAASARRANAELRAGMAEVRLKQAQLEELAAAIIATSSTAKIVGYKVLRQVETVFSDGEKSSAAAVASLKALAARRGANAIINLDTRQTPSGKWVARGDAVCVEETGRLGGASETSR